MDALTPIAVPAPVVLAPAGTRWPADRPRPHEALADALRAQSEPLGLYLQGLSLADAAAALAEWRSGPHWFRPAHVDPGSPVPDLADGAAAWDEALRAAQHADAVARSLTLAPDALRFDERLLYYLYLREPAELVPVRDRNAKYLYRYPIVEALEQAQEDSGAWLGASCLGTPRLGTPHLGTRVPDGLRTTYEFGAGRPRTQPAPRPHFPPG